MARLGTAVLAFLIPASIAGADVIPARYADPEAGAARARVAERLTSLGLSSEDARARTARLADAEARFFAAAPERVRAAGRDDGTESIPAGEKMILGVTFLGAAVAGIVVALAQD